MKLPDGKLLTKLRIRPDENERFDPRAMDVATGYRRFLADSK